MALKTNNVSIVFHGSLAPRLKLRQFASLEIILRGFVVDTSRRFYPYLQSEDIRAAVAYAA